jgi:hypothetical protein
MCGFLITDVSNFYRSISGITGHPLEKNGHLFIPWLLGAKSVCEYLVPFSNGRGKFGGPT